MQIFKLNKSIASQSVRFLCSVLCSSKESTGSDKDQRWNLSESSSKEVERPVCLKLPSPHIQVGMGAYFKEQREEGEQREDILSPLPPSAHLLFLVERKATPASWVCMFYHFIWAGEEEVSDMCSEEEAYRSCFSLKEKKKKTPTSKIPCCTAGYKRTEMGLYQLDAFFHVGVLCKQFYVFGQW